MRMTRPAQNERHGPGMVASDLQSLYGLVEQLRREVDALRAWCLGLEQEQERLLYLIDPTTHCQAIFAPVPARADEPALDKRPSGSPALGPQVEGPAWPPPTCSPGAARSPQ
jgi:hypothetical protein